MTTPTPTAPSGNGLVPYAPAVARELGFNERQLDLIKNQIAPGASDDDLAYFLEVCRSSGLNPIHRQIYAIMRGSDKNKRMTIQTGIDGYRLMAARTGALAGIDDAEFNSEDDKYPAWARVTVWRLVAGQRMPFTAKARWSEYAQYFDVWENGRKTGKQRLGDMWEKMPYLMLGKCAEALALRKAFPAELSGIYTAEEMAQADNPSTAYVEAVVEPTPAQPRQATATPPPARKSAAQPAVKQPWKSLNDPDVLAALNRMDIRGREATTAFMGTVKAEMESQGLAWTRDQVLAHLAEYALPAADDTHGLDELDTGIPG